MNKNDKKHTNPKYALPILLICLPLNKYNVCNIDISLATLILKKILQLYFHHGLKHTLNYFSSCFVILHVGSKHTFDFSLSFTIFA